MTEKEFEKIFKESFNRLCNLAVTIVKDSDTAKDIVQQVFTRLWNNLNSLSIESSGIAYLKRAVVNTALNHVERTKKIKFEEDLVAYESTSEEERNINPEEIKRQLMEAIESLPPKCQTVFSLSRFSGYTNKEIAEDLDISIKAVEKHITTAIKTLRIKLKPAYKKLFLIFYFL